MEEFLWFEKYRPTLIKDVVLPDHLKRQFEAFVEKKNVPNLILAGTPGVGKTTIARATLHEIDASYMFLNASLDGDKATLKTEIKDFASSMSMKGGRKYVILDEADNLTHHTQQGLRSFMEEYSANCGFILTVNNKFKINSALHSRCSLIEFNLTASDKVTMIKGLFKAVCSILDLENVDYDKKCVAEIVKKHFPDMRKTLNELQAYANATGKIDSGVLINFEENSFKKVIDLIKEKDMTGLRNWIAQSDVSDNDIYTKFYDTASKYVEPNSIPQLVLILADYQYKSAFAANPDINLAAAFVEMALEIEFK
jgi:replication factor C small subunit